MKRKILTLLIVAAAFLIQYRRGMGPNETPWPAALVAAFAAWALVQLVCEAVDRVRKR